jgi:hypothetical protein
VNMMTQPTLDPPGSHAVEGDTRFLADADLQRVGAP